MVPLTPTITKAGLALISNSPGGEFQLALTHVAFGAGKYSPTGDEITLVNEVARYPIQAGGQSSSTAIQIGVTLKNVDPYGQVIGDKWIGEIGFYAGSTLFAVWSRADKYLFHKSTEYDVPLAYTLGVSVLGEDKVTVQVELGGPAMQIMLFGHEQAADPHPQYMTPSETLSMLGAGMEAHLTAPDPHPQYVTKAQYAALDAKSWAEQFYLSTF